jgi:phosphopantothenoylcysteine decarboxylase/phosphopantothenate--cysteine ligase
VERVQVQTAAEMRAAVLARAASADIFIATAAVADYRPGTVAPTKIKKGTEPWTLNLEPTPDVLAEVAALSDRRPFCVGFAAETDRLTEHARHKLEAKRLDMIAANAVGEGLGIDTETNRLEVLWPGGRETLAEAPKPVLARRLVALVARRFLDTRTTEQPHHASG